MASPIKPSQPEDSVEEQKRPAIFVCYRRNDSSHAAGRIYDRLVERFGLEHVFMDVDTIPLGVDFRDHINEAVGRCDVLIAVIGQRWFAADEQGRRRIAALAILNQNAKAPMRALTQTPGVLRDLLLVSAS